MMRYALGIVILLFIFSSAPGADTFKWIDKEGHIHYGDRKPPEVEKAQTIQTYGPTEVQIREAISRNARLKAKLAESASGSRKSIPAKASIPSPAPTKPSFDRQSAECQARKRAYEKSMACFAPFMNANGSVKAEAFEQCTDIPQPEC